MSDVETAVARHYGKEGLISRIFAGLEAAGLDIDRLQPDDLAPVDEFHVGGRGETARLVAKLTVTADHHVLDIGCGIGGSARYIFGQTGARITGIDLTPEYIAVAKELTDRTGLTGKVTFETASALDMPFADGAFDAAVTIHVAMNIPDRPALYAEVARVLRPGALFCAFDLMKKNGEELAYPVPWAQSAETSHLITLDETLAFLDAAGFEPRDVDDRTEAAIEFFSQPRPSGAGGPPPLGAHLLMGPDSPVKRTNVAENIKTGRIAPVQVVAERRVG